ncbi:unnamed protein product [Rhizophagus irregularis]|nr:unnamed protein product [Rhizophagus irregularis]
MSFCRSHPRKIECLENASKEEIVELKSEISTLKSQLYQARKDVRDKGKYISSLEEQLVESEEQVKKLRCQIRSISSRKNSPERENSPDLMTTRDILIDQIKRATRQIRRKENNLHQDLVCEQRRRYDAEAERDNEIIQRQLAEGAMGNVVGDLHQLQTNGRNQRNAHHLQRSRGDIGLLEFNRDRLYERYEKWKNKTQAERQNILILQAQILALQNNPPNLINMALPAACRVCANIGDIRAANAGAITGAVASFPNVPLGLAAGGRPTNAVPVAVNAGGGIPVILAEIRAGQRLHRIKKHYPTANRYVKMLEIGSLKQGVHESVASFWAKIQKYGDQLGYTDAQKKTYFLSGVREDIREEGVLGPPPSYLNYTPTPPINPNIAPQQQGISLADIQKIFQDAQAQQKTENQALVKKVTELQSQMAQQAQASASQIVEPVRQPRGPPSSLKTEESRKDYYITEFLKDLGFVSKEEFDRTLHTSNQ